MREDLTMILIRKRPELVDNMDPDNGLLTELLARSILTKRQTKSIEVLRDPYKQNEAILDALHKRPDKDFEQFRQALIKTHQAEVADMLSPSSDKETSLEAEFKGLALWKDDVMAGSAEEHLKGGSIGSGTQETGPPDPSLAGMVEALCGRHYIAAPTGKGCLHTSTELYNLRKDESYPMSKIRRGLCYIFHVPDELSTKSAFWKSEENLKNLFECLHFIVEAVQCASAQVVRDTVLRLSRDPSLHDDQCIVIFYVGGVRLRGNGTEHGYRSIECLYGSDRVAVDPREILQPLAECAALRGKPKLIFIQSLDSGFTMRESSVSLSRAEFTPSPAASAKSAGYTESDAVPSAHHAPNQPITAKDDAKKIVSHQLSPNREEAPNDSMPHAWASSSEQPSNETSINQIIASPLRCEGAEGGTVPHPLSLRDFIIGFALHPGYVDAIVRVFAESAHDTDVSAMLRQVSGIMSEEFSEKFAEPNRKAKENDAKPGTEIRPGPGVVSLDDTLSRSYLYFFPGIVQFSC